MIVKVAGGPDEHLNNFLSLEKYYQDKYQQPIDQSGKDICRLCFLSTDNDFRCNYKSQVFDSKQHPVASKLTPARTPIETEPVVKPLTKTEQKQFYSEADDFAWLKSFTDKKLTYAEGSRNTYIFLFACNANRKGFDISDTLNYVSGFATDLDSNEIAETIRKAYNYNTAEHGKFKRQTNNGKRNSANSLPVESGTNTGKPGNSRPGSDRSTNDQKANEKRDEEFKNFWKEIVTEKGKGDQKYTSKRLELYRVEFINFLYKQGFFIIETGKEGYQICQRQNGVIRTVDPRKIKNHVYQWCKDSHLIEVEEMLRKGQKNYFAYTDLESLPVFSPDFVKDTPTEAFFFFQNCYVRITAESITTHHISEVSRAIWDTSIIKKDFTLAPVKYEDYQDESGFFRTDKIECDILKFILQVSTNPKKLGTEVSAETAGERFISICSSIGYMLHGWKNPISKAVLAVDHKMPGDRTEQNGGTGKSIIGRSFKYLKGVSELDGRDFDDKYPFRFESIDLDTKIVVMGDCKYNLDFGSFFVPITSDFRYNRRHTGYITIPFEDSPKWWFDTNFVFKGEGASMRRRQHIIEFDDYYNEVHNPHDEFGHLLFQDWDAAQWNMFYNFYFQCVQIHLDQGLVPYKDSNYDNRKLLVESNSEFIDWLDGTDDSGKYKIARNHWLSKKDLLKLWNEEAKSLNMQTISPHSFSKWVKKYCMTKGFVFHSKKSNSVEYYMVAIKEFDIDKAPAIVTQELPFGSTTIDFSKHLK